ncbi:MAG: UDP-N-acetylmuramoyl-L-alanine--D-glutamate ligase [Thermoleophilia bacterium]
MADDIFSRSRVLVVGAARSGVAAARAARRSMPDVEVVLADRELNPAGATEADSLREEKIILALGREDDALLDGCILVVKSPGVPNGISLLGEARQLGIPVIGEVEFAWRHLKNVIVGVTGTNGKTTTTELIGHIIKESGRSCEVAGNVGRPLSSLVGEVDEDAILVVELSSFQLEDTVDFRPDVAVLLNLTEDHLDRHPDVEHYYQSKTMIFANQGADDLAILNRDDPNSRRAIPGRARRIWFQRVPAAGGAAEPAAVGVRDGVICADLDALGEASAGLSCRAPWLAAGYEWQDGRKDHTSGEDSEAGGCREIVEWSRASLRGEHNLENALAATAACLSLGLATDEVAAGLVSFPGVRHRLQEVATVKGVTYVNDSKATNVDSAIKALTAYESGVWLILGGSSKGCSFDSLAAAAGDRVKQVLLIGESAPEIAAGFEQAGRETVMADRLELALERAAEGAEAGDVVLLSPACASFDQYNDYEERGEHFISLVHELEQGED